MQGFTELLKSVENLNEFYLERCRMNINKETDISAALQIGPTSIVMVRLLFSTPVFELPMDFTPEEAEEIAEEIKSAISKAREINQK